MTQPASRFRTPRFSDTMETTDSAATRSGDDSAAAAQAVQPYDFPMTPGFSTTYEAFDAYNQPAQPVGAATALSSPIDVPGLNSLLASPANSTTSFATQVPSFFSPSPPPTTAFPSTSSATSNLPPSVSGIPAVTIPQPGLSGLSRTSFYHPMNCRTEQFQPRQHENPWEARALLLMKGFSPNYRGDPDLARNRSAAIPAEQNCSLFLVGLAPDLTTHELLSGIRGVGRVYATHINPPDLERGHLRSAAKLVFFERAGAERFYDLYSFFGFSTPRNPHLRARVTWNRIRSAEVDVGGRKSRVLLVSGPPDVVNEQFLTSYLDTKLQYQVDEVLHRGLSPDGARVLLEFRFGSFRCQAEAARMALMREFRDSGVVCEYGWDPCDRPWAQQTRSAAQANVMTGLS
ncbi:RRM domain-containing protein [Madurella fahalii]|uniref:RRM domain-containing protein n=1 Tax=Madurella fahalii TaxID=1157608 RepID=A0ABQ0GN29_9PEZI